MANSSFWQRFYRIASTVVLGFVLTVPMPSFAEVVVEEDPSAAAMVGDLLIARPIGLGITVLGSLAYVVSLPFTLAGGNSKEAAETLMIGPARSTFMRCLGCTKTGRKVDQDEQDAMDAEKTED